MKKWDNTCKVSESQVVSIFESKAANSWEKYQRYFSYTVI